MHKRFYLRPLISSFKQIILIAGPNGAGKTTFSRKFIPSMQGFVHFVNADLIASVLSPFAPELEAIQAGRLMIRQIDTLSKLGFTDLEANSAKHE